MKDISAEIKFKTARSGGKGGQNVNKVETMVEGYWPIENSLLFSEVQKVLLKEKLAKKVNADGLFMMKSQSERTQLGNKAQVIYKMNRQVAQALIVRKKRKKTSLPVLAREKRLESKKKNSAIKENRKRVLPHE